MTEDTPTQDTQPDQTYESYLKFWQHSADAKQRTQEQLDGYLLKFSAGALTLSLSPATGLFETSVPAARCLLVLAWLLYLVTIGATMVSFRQSAKSADKVMSIAYRAMIGRDSGALDDHDAATQSTQTLNKVAISTFLFALLLSVIYLATAFLA